MEFFDTHAHLDDERLRSQLAGVLARAEQAGVKTILAMGTTVNTSQACVDLAQSHAGIHAVVGIQPNYVAEVQASDWDTIVELAENPHVVGLGETGLDRYWDHAPFPLQQDYFDRHLRLSQSTGLPFVVHMRNCGADVLEMLEQSRRQGELRGVMHSFTGDLPLMEACVALGMYVSFAGMLTYRNADDLRSVAALVPADRLLIETDSPYLSPHPHRQHRPNEPALVIHTAAVLADLRGVSLSTIAQLTTQNGRTLFRRHGR